MPPPDAPAYPSWLVKRSVEKLRWDDPRLDGFLRRGEPVIITGAPLVRRLVGRWTFDYLAQVYMGPPSLNVHFAPRNSRRYNRFYGEGVGQGGILMMTFSQFVSTVAKNEAAEKPPWRYYLQAMLLWSRHEEHNCKYEHGGELDVAGERLYHASMGRTMAEDLAHQVDYEWLRHVAEMSGCEGLSEVNLWAGRSGGCTPLHYDTTNNFLCQVSGRKRLLLLPPSAFAHVYPYPATHPMHFFGMVDVERPDLGRFPAFARAQGLEAIIEPGEVLWLLSAFDGSRLNLMADDGLPHQVLWLPSFWWHYVHQVAGDETLSLNFWMGATRDDRARACFAAEQAAQHAPPEDDAVGASALDAARDATTLDAAVAAGRGGPSPCPSPATDDMQLVGTDDGLVSMQLARHIEAETVRMFGEDPKHAGLFLNALAATLGMQVLTTAPLSPQVSS